MFNLRGIFSLLVFLLLCATVFAEVTITTFTGSGLHNTRPFTTSGPWEIQWNSKEQISISIKSLDGSRDQSVALNQNGKGSSYQSKAGQYYLHIASTGNWEIKVIPIPGVKETSRDGRFIAYNDGTVLDVRTNLMWAAKDNGSNINWYNAKTYCENYRGGGYTDWRMPTLDELEGLYDKNNSRPAACSSSDKISVATELIDISCFYVWTSKTRRSAAGAVNFKNAFITFSREMAARQSYDSDVRSLPVRTAKNKGDGSI
ncbi:MAG: DUF1566 domain-containing protein [Deltaproteobacteria bacterium]|nr:DUF1566 domain-containing protein [Deltaproteobacteria bacterium]